MASTPKTTLAGPSRPLGAPEIPQVFLPTTSNKGTYSPKLYGAASVHFRDRKRKVDQLKKVAFVIPDRVKPLVEQYALGAHTSLEIRGFALLQDAEKWLSSADRSI